MKLNVRLNQRNPQQGTMFVERLMKEHLARTSQSAAELAERLADHPSSRADAIASICTPVLNRYHPMPPGSIRIELGQWQRILEIATPEEFDLMVSRGLALGTYAGPVFEALEQRALQDITHAQRIAKTIAQKMGPVTPATNASGNIAWRDKPFFLPRIALVADFMRAQAKAFPNCFEQLALHAVQTSDVDRILMCHLAGVPASAFPLALARTVGLSELTDLFRSSHGRLRVAERTGTLEQYLSSAPMKCWN